MSFESSSDNSSEMPLSKTEAFPDAELAKRRKGPEQGVVAERSPEDVLSEIGGWERQAKESGARFNEEVREVLSSDITASGLPDAGINNILVERGLDAEVAALEAEQTSLLRKFQETMSGIKSKLSSRVAAGVPAGTVAIGPYAEGVERRSVSPDADDAPREEAVIAGEISGPGIPKIFQMGGSLEDNVEMAPAPGTIDRYDLPADMPLAETTSQWQQPLGTISGVAPETEQPTGIAEDSHRARESFLQKIAKDKRLSGDARSLEQQKEDEYVKKAEKAFEQKEFSNEDEMLDFLREIAENGPFEFSAVYGMDDFGHLKKFSGSFGSRTSVEINPNILKNAKKYGITKLVFAHTHPNEVMESNEIRSLFSVEERQKLTRRGRIDMPPSGPDVRMAGELDWADYYDDPTKFEGQGGVKTQGVVVTSEGVWKFQTNFFHPAMERQRSESIRLIEESPVFQEWKSENNLSDDEARYIFRIMQVPDDLARARVLTDPKYRDAFRSFNFYNFLMKARSNTELNEDRIQFAWAEEQKKFALASPEGKTAAVERFAAFCKKNGVDMRYIPFEKQN